MQNDTEADDQVSESLVAFESEVVRIPIQDITSEPRTRCASVTSFQAPAAPIKKSQRITLGKHPNKFGLISKPMRDQRMRGTPSSAASYHDLRLAF